MTWALFIVGFINAVLGFVVFGRTKPGRERIVFISIMMALAFWLWGIALFIISSSLWRAQLFVDIYYIAAISIASSVLAFAFIGANVRSAFLVWFVSYVPTIAWILLLTAKPTGFVHVISTSGALSSRVEINQSLYLIYTLIFCIYYAVALTILYITALKSHDVERRRKLLIAHGIVVASLGGMVFNLFLPGVGVYDLIAIGPLFSILFAASVTYSIVKYSLFDLRQSFLLSFTYVVTFGALIFIQGAAVWLINTFFLNDSADTQVPALVNAAVLVVVAAMFQPIKSFFDRVTENVFFHYEYHTQDVLAQIGKVIAQHIDLEPFTKRILQIIAKSIQVGYVEMCIIDNRAQPIHRFTVGKAPRNDLFTACDKQVFSHVDPVLVVERLSSNSPTYRQLRDAGIAAITKLETANGTNGYIFIGNKLGGTALSYKDVNLLTLLAGEIALAVENNLRYEEIKQFSETLRSRVDEATEELRSSNKKLKQMDQTKDEFISLTSHQLRTPLTTVKGYISMILDGDAGEVNPQQRKLLEEAFNSSQRMVHLISDFLNISRIQTGKFVVELTDVNLADILDEEIEQLRIAAKSRKLTLVYDKPADFPEMQIDEGKIRQVMMNFIDNAIYYSLENTTITVILSHTASIIEFKVIDHGIGVPRAEQHKLFAKFSRASNARKQRPDGTGIGLFMAKKVIVALSGAIIFQSEEGKGSTFGFRLNRPRA